MSKLSRLATRVGLTSSLGWFVYFLYRDVTVKRHAPFPPGGFGRGCQKINTYNI